MTQRILDTISPKIKRIIADGGIWDIVGRGKNITVLGRGQALKQLLAKAEAQ